MSFSLDADEVPAVCLATCDDAFQLAYLIGKEAELCTVDSAFMNGYDTCLNCVIASQGGRTTAEAYIKDKFAQYIGYCEAAAPAPNPSSSLASSASLGDGPWSYTLPTGTSTVYVSTGTVALPTIMTSDGEIRTMLTSSFITTTIPLRDYYFTIEAMGIISSLLPLPVFTGLATSVASAASNAGVIGNATDLMYSALFTPPIPPWFSSAIPSTYAQDISAIQAQIMAIRPASIGSGASSLPSTASTSATEMSQSTFSAEADQPMSNKSNARIAGPVVGCVAGILLIALGTFLVSRCLKRPKVAKESLDTVEPNPEDKPQLHSDSRALYELEDQQARPEMIGNEMRWELPANEQSLELPIDNHIGPDTEINGELVARAAEPEALAKSAKQSISEIGDQGPQSST